MLTNGHVPRCAMPKEPGGSTLTQQAPRIGAGGLKDWVRMRTGAHCFLICKVSDLENGKTTWVVYEVRPILGQDIIVVQCMLYKAGQSVVRLRGVVDKD